MSDMTRGGLEMKRVSRTAAVAILLLLCNARTVFGQAEPKFRPAASPVGWDRYVVSVTLQPGEELDALARQLAATYRGRLETFAQEGFTGLRSR
jgi:hypothetical protein